MPPSDKKFRGGFWEQYPPLPDIGIYWRDAANTRLSEAEVRALTRGRKIFTHGPCHKYTGPDQYHRENRVDRVQKKLFTIDHCGRTFLVVAQWTGDAVCAYADLILDHREDLERDDIFGMMARKYVGRVTKIYYLGQLFSARQFGDKYGRCVLGLLNDDSIHENIYVIDYDHPWLGYRYGIWGL